MYILCTYVACKTFITLFSRLDYSTRRIHPSLDIVQATAKAKWKLCKCVVTNEWLKNIWDFVCLSIRRGCKSNAKLLLEDEGCKIGKLCKLKLGVVHSKFIKHLNAQDFMLIKGDKSAFSLSFPLPTEQPGRFFSKGFLMSVEKQFGEMTI